MKYGGIIFFVILLLSCSGIPDYSKTEGEINIIIVVDVSDRISNRNQRNRDTTIIKHIFNQFDRKIRNEGLITSSYKFHTIDINNADINQLKYDENLTLDFSQIADIESQMSSIGYKLNEFDSLYTHNITNMYNDILNYPDRDKNIWKFFNDNLHVSLSLDTSVMNHVFIISDGYLQENNYSSDINDFRISGWKNKLFSEQLIKELDKDFNVQSTITFLEIEPQNNFDYEYDLLQESWNKWFNSIGFINVNFLKNSDNLSIVLKKINEILNSKGSTIPDLKKVNSIQSNDTLYFDYGYYVGGFKNDMPNGIGQFFYNKKSRIYQEDELLYVVSGRWDNGLREGPFEAISSDGVKFIGNCNSGNCVLNANGDKVLFLTLLD